jgi:kynurenine formamidase
MAARLALVASILATVSTLAQAPPKVIDLGHPLSTASPTWSGEPAYSRTVVAEVAKDGYNAGRFSVDEHFGTHLDAPAHFGGDWTVDQIPVDRLVRPAVCLNIVAQVARDEDYRLSVADVRAFEQKQGPISEGVIVLVATGWDARWSDPARYMNTKGGVKHFPGISIEAARYLAMDRRVVAIGIDTGSIDYGPSTAYESHQTTMQLNLYHVENAANLTKLPPKGFTVVVAPINIEGGSGGPTRIFALLP